MSIERMALVNIFGRHINLDNVLLKCVKCELFHPETVASKGNESVFQPQAEQNPYTALLRQLEELLTILDIPASYSDYSDLNMTEDELEEYLENIYQTVVAASDTQKKLIDEIRIEEQSLVHVKHMTGMDANIEDVFTSKYTSVRFGRLPIDSQLKLDYYKDKNFVFIPFDKDEAYIWGIYCTPTSCVEEIDEIFRSLYFDRFDIPDYVHGTPELAVKNLSEKVRQKKIELQKIEVSLGSAKKENAQKIQKVFSKIKMLHDTYVYRKYAAVGHKKFYLKGFVPKNRLNEFIALFDSMDDVICEEMPADADERLTPPVKLKTNWLFRPFEMFVEIYGLPKYDEINPTTYIGIIYTILFGIMFGDFGQGLCVVIVGILMWKIKDMALGLVLTRCGVASMFFGLLYGSCFGFEGQFKPLFEALGLSNIFPLDVLDSTTSLTLLIISLGIGILIILFSMGINIVIGLKKREYGRALFSNNGIAGLVLYGGVIIAAILLLVLNINLFNPIFLILVVLLPLIFIFFAEPLGKKLKKHKNKDDEKFHIMDAAFEMVDVILSYCTNTLSFLRVGGFILTHAALMLVVMQFAHMAGSFGSPIVIVLGNLFVMGLEGLIVSIQVLRLVYYETFSRFYTSDGKPFSPAKVRFDEKKK